jgi:DNA ligase (NAD+)
VVVEKAGKIIPHIVRVEKHLRKGSPRKFVFPTACPECDTKLIKDEGGVYIRCPNPLCPAQVKERIRYFASRNAMDIEGLGDKLVDQLVSDGIVKTCGDLYRLEERQDRLLNLERMGRKSLDNLLDGIEKSKNRGLARLLNALSIRHVGARVASVLAEHFGTMEALLAAKEEELSEVNEIGPIIAASVYSFLHSKFGKETIADLESLGVNTKSTAPARGQRRALEGKTLVVTGTLTKYTRDEIEELITQNGGHAASSVSKKTDYVVAGENAGSKLEKAKQLDVPVITEVEFEGMLKQGT